MEIKDFNLPIQQYLSVKKIKRFTPIQNRFFDVLKQHKNVIGISPTGSGKTLAYLLPILQNLNLQEKNIQAVIICPTRELARQVETCLAEFKKFQPELKSALWIGGLDLNKLISNATKSYSHIVVATPTRFLEVVNNIKNIKFKFLSYFVLDEADMLLDLNFYNEIIQIDQQISCSTSQYTKIATSATLHQKLNNELSKIFKNCTIIDLNNCLQNQNNIKHFCIKTNDKDHALAVLMQKINPYFCLIFTNTKKTADRVYKHLLNQNYNVINLHSGLKTRERKNNYKSIKQLNYQYVVASDLLSRGLDVDGASHVINYDFPISAEWYIHRSGRAGRGIYTGESYLFLTNNDEKEWEKLKCKKIDFSILQIKNNELVSNTTKLFKKRISSTEQEQEIRKLISSQTKIVKPGYKKKIKNEIKKIKQKYKHRYLNKLMKNKKKL